MSYCQQIISKTQNLITCKLTTYILFCAIQLHCCPKTITNKLMLIVDFDSLPHAQSCCHKCSVEHQMCIIRLLKVVPNRFPFDSYLSTNLCIDMTFAIIEMFFCLFFQRFASSVITKNIITTHLLLVWSKSLFNILYIINVHNHKT